MNRAAAAVGAGAVLGLVASCSVGDGSGAASGSLFVVGCNDGVNYGTAAADGTLAAIPYNVAPTFFAGGPIEDLAKGEQAMNQLELRMQSSGLQQAYVDQLDFDVINSYEVARCVRGRTNADGTPDYLVNQPLPLVLGSSPTPPPVTLWCDWSGMAFSDGGAPDAAVPGTPDAGMSLDGGVSTMATAPRIHLTPYTDLHASLALAQTCPGGIVAGAGVDGWIQFQNFGAAEQSDRSPADRETVPHDFVINFGDRVRASFHVVIGDPRVVDAVQNGTTPPTTVVIGGELDGYFDFDLARGRSGQSFP